MQKVSIIIPVYNVAKYIVRCIESVVNQTYPNIECILVDDCGQDDSVALAEQRIVEYQQNFPSFQNLESLNKAIDFKILHHDHNRGVSAARNTGTRAATGDYIFYMDSDDEITPDCIEIMMSFVEKYPDVEMVQGNTKVISKLTPNRYKYLETTNYPEYINDNQWVRNSFWIDVVWNKLILRSFIIDNDLIFNEKLSAAEDVLWLFFAVKKLKSIAFSAQRTYIYYIVENSLSAPENQIKNLKNHSKVLTEIINNFDEPCRTHQIYHCITLIYDKMRNMNVKKCGKDLYNSYRQIVIKLLRQEVFHQNIFLSLALCMLALPQFVITSYVGRRMFNGLIKLSKN